MSALLPAGLAAVAASQTPSSAPDSSTAVGIWWLVGASCAAVIFNQLSDAWQKLTGRFKEREPNGPEYVTRQACHTAHTQTETHFKEMENRVEAKVTEIRGIFREDIQGVHNRINDVLEKVSELKGKVSK
jgi:bifunctional pyridoxal-dependent enzyme with beta-cystathionase and maltose regulon repressor activities